MHASKRRGALFLRDALESFTVSCVVVALINSNKFASTVDLLSLSPFLFSPFLLPSLSLSLPFSLFSLSRSVSRSALWISGSLDLSVLLCLSVPVASLSYLPLLGLGLPLPLSLSPLPLPLPLPLSPPPPPHTHTFHLLLSFFQARRAAMTDGGALVPLAALLSSGTDMAKSASASTLLLLANGSEERCTAIAGTEGTVAALVKHS